MKRIPTPLKEMEAKEGSGVDKIQNKSRKRLTNSMAHVECRVKEIWRN